MSVQKPGSKIGMVGKMMAVCALCFALIYGVVSLITRLVP
jgi:uncharacterized membrane protein